MRRYPTPVRVDQVRGDATGLVIPAHAEALRLAGSAFLTEAFRAFGSISADNAVVRVERMERQRGGNSGDKLHLRVRYARPEPSLHEELFVKFSRDFDDGFRDRRKHEMAAEVHIAELSRHPAFPVAVPRPYFADFHDDSGTGILITQAIAFGEGTIEPLHPKCKDHRLEDPAAYYRAIYTALARLAAAHKSGRLSPEAERLFPHQRRDADNFLHIPHSEKELQERIALLEQFAATCPQLLPTNVASSAFLRRFRQDAPRFLTHQNAIRNFIQDDPRLVALCHWNANIDNAWFWRDRRGELHCGLLDWGRSGQMPIGVALWSSLSMSTLDVWNQHLDELLSLYLTTLRVEGGPSIDLAELRLHLQLAVALVGLTLTLDTPHVVLSRLPAAAEASGPLDPIFATDSVAQGFLQGFASFLNLWERLDFGTSLDMLQIDKRL